VDGVKNVDEVLREAVASSGLSVDAIARAAVVPKTCLSRFLGGGLMNMRNAERLWRTLGYELSRSAKVF
jgi:hypothetical protein